HAECGPEESKHFDKGSEETLSLRSSPFATVTYRNGELIANIQGVKADQKTLTVPRSNPSNIIFRNETEGKFRLVAHLGGKKDSAEKGHSGEACTQLVEPGAEQSLTLNIPKPSGADNTYYLFIAGAEEKRIAVVVP
ncbi:MAG: hypothetical protein FJW19_05350, partial [Actinobacteria bacterium]|nr:hypothetical protein [Actinomycetota bacterium]